MKIIIKLAMAVGLIAGVLFCLFVWGGGYWENRPFLDRISGPMRFEQFVAKPLPPEIYDLKGGYSGFPQGRVLTFFKYRGNIRDLKFLENWIVSFDSMEFPLQNKKASQVFVKDNKYLLFDFETNQGLLFIP